jgi:hypothetical protein
MVSGGFMKDGSVRSAHWLRRPVQFILFLTIVAVAILSVSNSSWRDLPLGQRASKASSNLRSAEASAVNAAERTHWKDLYAQLPLSFEANGGQAGKQVKFVSRGRGYALFLTPREAVLELQGRDSRLDARNSQVQAPGSALRMQLAGANPRTRVQGIDELPGKSNYFTGNTPSKWRTGVANYARVRYEEVYPGIDLVFYGNQRRLEYDFVAKPGADPQAIALKVRGAGHARVDSSGNLVLELAGRQVVFDRPLLYQDGAAGKASVQGGYTLGTPRAGVQEVRFQVGDYDRSRALVIDPSLTYSTYLGGSDNDQANGIAIDSAGNAYITGQTFSSNFPVQAPEQGTCPPAGSTAVCSSATGKSDVFVSKINAAGTALVYSTYLGGSFLDFGVAIAVDPAGDAYVTGETLSTDFPLKNAFQTTGDTLGDAFITEFNPSGSALVYSTYLGGTGTSIGQGIAADSGGNAYVVGTTNATDFPVAGAYQSTNQGESDVFVAKIAPLGASKLYSTYLGGAGNDTGTAIAVGPAGNAYVTGQTMSNNFPTATPYQSSYGGLGDAFVTKLILSGAKVTLGYSTYLGGTNADEAWGIALDSSNNAYVTGATSSIDFPSASPFQANLPGGTGQHAFVSKLSTSGTTLVYSTYLGGTGSDTARAIAVDSAGVAHVVGYTTSSNFPTANPIQNTYAGNTDAFLARINSMGCGLAFSTFLGGKSTDEALGVAVDHSGNSYLTGLTGSNDFPTASPFQGATHGNNDAILAKVPAISAPNTCVSPTALVFPAQEATTASSALNVTLTNDGTGDLSTTSIGATGPFTETNTCGSSVAAGQNCTIGVVFTPTASGPANGTLTITDNAAGASSAEQNVALSGTGTDFALAITPAVAAISAGQSATFTLTLTSSLLFTDAVTLTCNSTVLAGTCTISPGSITPSGGASATATVTATSSSSLPPPPSGFGNRTPPLGWPLGFLALGLLVSAAWARRTGSRRLWANLVVLAGVSLLAMAWFGCGVNNSAPTHTPPGNYTVTITGTAGSLSHAQRAQITVQ